MNRLKCIFLGHQWALRFKPVDGDRKQKIICDRCGASLNIRIRKEPKKRRTVANDINETAKDDGLFGTGEEADHNF
jgi:hypothetical protein